MMQWTERKKKENMPRKRQIDGPKSDDSNESGDESDNDRTIPNKEGLKGRKGEVVKFCVVFLCFIVGIALLVYYRNNKVDPRYCNPQKRDCEDFLVKQIKHLSEKYKNQSNMLWAVLHSAAIMHVQFQPRPVRPIVVMTYNCHGSPSENESIYADISEMYEAVLIPNKKRGFLKLNGSDFVGVDPDEVQKQIQAAFEDGYKKEGKRVAVVHNFDSLPSCSVLMFHNLCNNNDAPYKDMAIILSVEGDEKHRGTTKGKELEQIISDKFHDRWKDCPEYLPSAKIDTMLSIVAKNVVILT